MKDRPVLHEAMKSVKLLREQDRKTKEGTMVMVVEYLLCVAYTIKRYICYQT